MVNIREFSVMCGNCRTYQTLSGFARAGEINVYTYECENETCAPEVTRTLVEVHRDVDEFANRDPNWRGGGRHGAHGDESTEDQGG